MGIIIRQSVQNSVISYTGVALGFVVTILMYPNILSAEQYGLTRVLLSLSVVITQIANLGVNNTIIRFFPYFKDKEQNHHGFLFIALAVPMTGFLIFSILFGLFHEELIRFFIDRSDLLEDYYWYLLPLAFFILFFSVLNYFIRSLYDTVLASFLNDVFIRILTMVLLVVYHFGWITFNQFMLFFVVNYAITLGILFFYTLFRKNVTVTPDFEFLSSPLLKKMVNYSLYAFWGGVASILVSNIDIIMLSSLAGLEETGIYAIAFYVGTAILIIRQSIYKISSPVIATAFKENDYGLIEDIYKRSALNQIIGGGLLYCGIIANLDNLIAILPEAYAGGAVVIVIIASANLFDMSTGINGGIILNSKHYRFDLYSTIFLIIITVILNYLLIPPYGIIGAAIGTASAVFLYNAVKVFFVWIRFSMQPFEWKMLIVVMMGAIILFISFQVGTIGNIYIDIFVRSAVITITYILPIVAMNISSDLNDLFQKILTSINKIRVR